MPDFARRWWTRCAKLVKGHEFPLAIAGLILAAMAWWVWPRRLDRVYSADGVKQWRAADAPPRREIVWQTPEQLSLAGSAPENAERWITPRLADGGAVLYFARRNPQGQADIFRARRLDGQWTDVTPMGVWNSPEDDLAPAFTADGQRAYFSSNRPGGQGGFDVYESHRNGDDWSAPVNLGAKVNSPVHEYDPAPGPEGKLFFSSNRSAKDARPSKEDRAAWDVTLRAHPGAPQFDLYVAWQAGPEQTWQEPQPLAELNLPNANEGAPCATANGAFLYFASDRHEGNHLRNLDLYRARWNGTRFIDVESLGGDVNSAAHDTEPSLAADGFSIVFSSDRGGQDALYRSTATEVLHDVVWDASRLRALGAIWWQALLVTLVFAGVVAAFWWSRGWLFEKASTSRFFAISVLFHCVVLLLMGVVPLAKVVIEIAHEIRAGDAASQLFDDNQHQSHKPGLEAYEKLADLQSATPVETPELMRQDVEEFSVPQHTDTPVVNIPLQVARNVPANRIEFVPVAQPPKIERKPDLPRQPRRPVELAALPDALPLDQLPEEATPEETIAEADFEVARQNQTASPAPNVERPTLPARRPVARLAAVEPDQIEMVPELPDDAGEAPVVRAMKPDTKPREEPLTAEAAPAAEKAAEETAAAPVVATVERAAPERIAAPNAPIAAMPRAPLRAPAPAEIAPAAENEAEQTLPATTPAAIARKQTVFTPESKAPAEAPAPGEAAPTETNAATEVALARGAEASPLAELGLLPRPALMRRRPAAELPADVAAAPESATPAPMNTPRPPVELARAAVREKKEQDAAELQKVTAVEPSPLDEPMVPPAAGGELARKDVAEPVATTTAAAPAKSPLRTAQPDALALALRSELPAEKAAAQTKQSGVMRRLADSLLPKELQSADTVNDLTAVELPAETPLAAVESPVAKAEPLAVPSGPETPKEIGGPMRRTPRTILATLTDRRLDAPPSFALNASQLNRLPALAKRVAIAEDNVGMEAMFMLRQGDTRREFIDLFGGTEATEAAVNRGLVWLAAHQNENGSWSLQKNEGASVCDTAGTGIALLPFLAAGHTPAGGQYQPQVQKAIQWMIAQQKPDGNLLAAGDNAHNQMYAHGIATIALCEAYGMSKAPELKEPTQKALGFIVKAQNPSTGGWRYLPGDPGDTSVVGWQLMALKSGEMAGIAPPQATLDLAAKFLASVEGNKPTGGYFGYAAPGGTLAMTAEGLLCLQFLGLRRDDPRMKAGAAYLLQNPPKAGVETSYYWYYATQVMYHMQGDHWTKWNASTRDLLVDSQVKDGANAGTWNPGDNWEKAGGRVFSTSLKLLMLEVYYRHLPLYQQLED